MSQLRRTIKNSEPAAQAEQCGWGGMLQMDLVADQRVRLDSFLSFQEGVKSRSAAKRLIESGSVLVNGKKVRKASHVVQSGDKVSFNGEVGSEKWVVDSKKSETNHSPLSTIHSTPTILYEDPSCLVIDKPADLAVHSGHGMKPGEPTVLSIAETLFARKNIPFSESEVLVHRLDKDTTGCLLLAKTPKAHMQLQKQFQDRTVRKTYLAFVEGVPEHKHAKIDAPIGRSAQDRTKMSVHQRATSRNAQTTYTVLGHKNGVSLLACELHTGRTHQIRVHLKSIGHPILGDKTYHSNASAGKAHTLGIERICLHAWKLEFDAGTKRVKIQSKLPAGMQKVLTSLKIEFEMDRE